MTGAALGSGDTAGDKRDKIPFGLFIERMKNFCVRDFPMEIGQGRKRGRGRYY